MGRLADGAERDRARRPPRRRREHVAGRGAFYDAQRQTRGQSLAPERERVHDPRHRRAVSSRTRGFANPSATARTREPLRRHAGDVDRPGRAHDLRRDRLRPGAPRIRAQPSHFPPRLFGFSRRTARAAQSLARTRRGRSRQHLRGPAHERSSQRHARRRGAGDSRRPPDARRVSRRARRGSPAGDGR